MILISIEDYLKAAYKINKTMMLKEEGIEYGLNKTNNINKQYKYHDKLFKQILSN